MVSASRAATAVVAIAAAAVAVCGQGRKKCVTPKRVKCDYIWPRRSGKEKERGVWGRGRGVVACLTSIKVEKLQKQVETSLQRLHDTKSIINIC